MLEGVHESDLCPADLWAERDLGAVFSGFEPFARLLVGVLVGPCLNSLPSTLPVLQTEQQDQTHSPRSAKSDPTDTCLGVANEVSDGQDVARVGIDDRGIAMRQRALRSRDLDDLLLTEPMRPHGDRRAAHKGSV